MLTTIGIACFCFSTSNLLCNTLRCSFSSRCPERKVGECMRILYMSELQSRAGLHRHRPAPLPSSRPGESSPCGGPERGAPGSTLANPPDYITCGYLWIRSRCITSGYEKVYLLETAPQFGVRITRIFASLNTLWRPSSKSKYEVLGGERHAPIDRTWLAPGVCDRWFPSCERVFPGAGWGGGPGGNPAASYAYLGRTEDYVDFRIIEQTFWYTRTLP